jgi:hypothetical protein
MRQILMMTIFLIYSEKGIFLLLLAWSRQSIFLMFVSDFSEVFIWEIPDEIEKAMKIVADSAIEMFWTDVMMIARVRMRVRTRWFVSIVFLFSNDKYSSVVLFLKWLIFSKLIFQELIFSKLIVLVSTSLEIVVIFVILIVIMSVTNNSLNFVRSLFREEA